MNVEVGYASRNPSCSTIDANDGVTVFRFDDDTFLGKVLTAAQYRAFTESDVYRFKISERKLRSFAKSTFTIPKGA